MDIANFTDLYQRAIDDRKIVGIFVSGHLAVEYLLRKILVIHDPSKQKLADELTHAKLIDLVFGIGAIDANQRDVLTQLNRMRNKFAHRITYEPTVGELKLIYKAALTAFSDLTDGIAQGLDALEACSGIHDLEDYAIPELFIQICYDLHEKYHELGGDIEDF
jgi:hypothetical protein